MDVKLTILETTVTLLRQHRLNIHAAEVEKAIQYIQMKEAGVPNFVEKNKILDDTPMPLDGAPLPVTNHTFDYSEHIPEEGNDGDDTTNV